MALPQNGDQLDLLVECQEIMGRFAAGPISLDDLEPGEASKLMDMISLHREHEA